MGIEKKCFLLFFELKHKIFHHFPTDRIESTHRLIEKYNLGVMENRLGETYTLEHTFRVRVKSLVASLEKSNFFENFIFSFGKLFSLKIIECRIKIEEFIPCKIFVKIGIFWHKSDLMTRIEIFDTSSLYFYLSTRRSHNSEDTLHRRCLSCSIGPKKSENLPFFEREAHVVKKC